MQTESIVVHVRHSDQQYVQKQLVVPSEHETLRIARELHAARKHAITDVLGWRVLYTPPHRLRGHTQPFDPITGQTTGAQVPFEDHIPARCTFGVAQEWTVSYVWGNGQDSEPTRVEHSPVSAFDHVALFEGTLVRAETDHFERSAEARRQCIAHYGAACYICGFDFAHVYGEDLAGFILVHHLVPLAAHGEQHQVDPFKDLRPSAPIATTSCTARLRPAMSKLLALGCIAARNLCTSLSLRTPAGVARASVPHNPGYATRPPGHVACSRMDTTRAPKQRRQAPRLALPKHNGVMFPPAGRLRSAQSATCCDSETTARLAPCRRRSCSAPSRRPRRPPRRHRAHHDRVARGAALYRCGARRLWPARPRTVRLGRR